MSDQLAIFATTKPDYLAVAHRLLEYDPSTGIFTWKAKLNKHCTRARIGGRAGTKLPIGYRVIALNYQREYEHRIAWAMTYGYWPDPKIHLVDHVNGIRDDNRISNLRLVDESFNARNLQQDRRIRELERENETLKTMLKDAGVL